MLRLLRFAFVIFFLVGVIAALVPFYLEWRTRSLLFRTTEAHGAPHPAQVALIPGASVLPNKKPSNTLLGRLRAGIELYNKNIVPKLLLSGDNQDRYYDEVHAMRDYCLRHGVKPEDIFLDHKGQRTYDTMLRASRVFGVKTAVVVSQELYLPRALFLAESLGLKAEGYVAEASSFDNTWPAWGREYLARLKSVIDIYALHPQVDLDGGRNVSGDGRATWKK